MIEIFNIIIQILFSFLIISFPINLFQNNSKLKILSIEIIDKLAINLVFFVNFLLIVSLLSLNISYVFIFYIVLIILSYSINFKKINYKKLQFNYYLLLIFIFTFLISIDLAHELYFSWDTSSNWYFKTLNFFQDKNLANLKNFNNDDYPHLGGYIWSFFWKFPIGQYEYLGRIFYIFIYVISVFSLINCLNIEKLQKIIFSILFISLTYKYTLFSGLQDVLIFSFMILAARFIYLFYDKKSKFNPTHLIFIILGLVNIIFWLKNEGVFYGFFILFCLLIVSHLSKINKLYIIIGSLTFILLRVFVFNYYNIELHDDYFEFKKTFSFEFIEIINNIKIITFYLLINVTRNLLYLICIPLLFYIAVKYDIKNITKFVSYFFILNLIFIYATYLFKMDDVELLITAGMDRVIFQTSGIYFLIVIVFVNYYSNLSKKIK